MFKSNLLTGLPIFTLFILLAGRMVLPAAAAQPSRDVITVGSGPGCTFGSMQAAVNAANDGDTIQAQAGTFSGGDASFNVQDKSLTIIGGYAISCIGTPTQRTILEMNGQAGGISVIRLTSATANRYVTLHNFVVRGGVADNGGGINIGKHFTVGLHNVTIRDNHANDKGGGVYMRSSGVEDTNTGLSLFNSEIISNTAEGSGGGIYSNNADVFLQDGSAVGRVGEGNQAGIFGGGIYSINSNGHVIANGPGEISDNHSLFGGGVYVSKGQVVFTDGFVVQGNGAARGGGGILASGTNHLVVLSNTSVISNTAEKGGGVYLGSNVTAVFSGTTLISGNVVTATVLQERMGGGVYMGGSGDTALTLSQQVTIANNTAAFGGGIAVDGRYNELTLWESVEIRHNQASDSGGGIYVSWGDLSIRGDLFARPSLHSNHADVNGGGLFARGINVDPILITETDIYGNTAGNGAGGYIEEREIDFVNTLFEGNVAASMGGGLLLTDEAEGVISAEFAPTVPTGCTSDNLLEGQYCSQFRANQAPSAAAIGVYSATLATSHTAILDNQGDNSIFVAANSGEVTIDTVLFRDNQAADNLLWVDGAVTVVVLNSTLYRNAGAAITVAPAVNLIQIERSIIWGNEEGTNIGIGATFTSACNIVQGVADGALFFSGVDDDGSDPLLANWADGGYLTDASPAIDACAGGVAFDLNGKLRPMNGDGAMSAQEYDRGAFELDPAAVPLVVQLVGGERADSAETLPLWVSLMLLLTIVAIRPDKRRVD